MPFSNVLVTGASSGIGRALALHYASTGATVHALARRAAELESLAGAARGGRIRPVVLDVTDAEALAGAVEEAGRAAGGALDLVVANAGTGDLTSGRHMDWRAVRRVLEVNATGAAVAVAAALPAMVARGAGTVAAVASLAAFRGLPGAAAYCASKAALHVFMESVRVDLIGTGVKAVTIYPGFVRTEMTAANRFPMPFLMDLEPAVRAITKGIDRGDAVIAFPFAMATVTRLLGAVPRWLYEPLAARRRPPRRDEG